MKSKKSFRLFLGIDLCLLLAAILLICACMPEPFPTESGFPMWQKTFYTFSEESSLELLDRRPVGGGKEVLWVKALLEEKDRYFVELQEDGGALWQDDFSICFYSEADSAWYRVYTPVSPSAFAEGRAKDPREALPLEAGEQILEFTVPFGVFAKEGQYVLETGSLGWAKIR